MNEPLLTVLNFSGGKQSSWMLWRILRGEVSVPKHFAVLNANPGMENTHTYEYVAMMRAECEARGIYFKTVAGPDLYKDLVNLKAAGKTRIDNPPYWTKDANGKVGQLKQACTAMYKIAPMDREVRRLLHQWHGISLKTKRIPAQCVRKWIGFTLNEAHRMKPSRTKYTFFQYPAIDERITNEMIVAYFRDNSIPMPPRSVCNACFANGIDFLKEMHDNRPVDWEQAVAVDEAVRDMSQVGVKETVYVSRSCIPLRELAARNFKLDDKKNADEYSCDSGYCFT